MTIHDAIAIATLVLLEALLSADNALVLALLARRLPEETERNRALTLGMSLSFALRVVGLSLAKLIIKFWFLRAAGSAYLLYLAIRHFADVVRGNPHSLPPDSEQSSGEAPATDDVTRASRDQAESQARFRRVVTAIALTDVAFAIDSILVAVAVTDSLWVILTGVALGIVALRLLAGAFLKLLERFPALEHTAYALVAWAGIKLGLEAAESFGVSVRQQHWHIELSDGAFWIGMGVIIVLGSIFAARTPASSEEKATDK